jgi:predicted lipoprotein with Yx(FWY)xxD motif
MKKGIIIAAIAILVIGGGAYAIFGMPSSPKSPAKQNTSGQSARASVNNAVLTTKTDSRLGKYLADPNGKPLYTYNADSKGVSNCTGACLANWPAYRATGSVSNLPSGVSTIKRADNGQTQYTYNGMPLYYFTADQAGNPTGDGVENFSIAVPPSSQPSTAPATSSQNSTSNSSSGYRY